MENGGTFSTSSDNCFAFRLTAGRSALNMGEAACECKADDNGNGPRLNDARTGTAVEAVAEVLMRHFILIYSRHM